MVNLGADIRIWLTFGSPRYLLTEPTHQNLFSVDMKDSNQGAQEHVIRAVQAGGNERLLGAKEALKERLMRAVLDQAIHELGEPASIARSVMAQYGTEIQAVAATSQILKQLLLAEIERATSESLSDPNATATELFSRINGQWSEPESIKDSLRELILDSSASQAISSLGEADAAAEEIMSSDRVSPDRIESISGAVRDRVISAATDHSIQSLANREDVATEILNDLGSEHATIVETSLSLEVLIREEIRRRAEATLGESESLAQQVYESLENAEEQVRAVATTVADRIVREIADNVGESINDSAKLVGEADKLIDNRQQAVDTAISELTSAIVGQIADRTKGDLAESDAIAQRVMDRLEENPEVVSRFTAAAKERVLADVVNNAISELSDDLGTHTGGLPAQTFPEPSTDPTPEPTAAAPEPSLEDSAADDLGHSFSDYSAPSDDSPSFGDDPEPTWSPVTDEPRVDRPASSGKHSDSAPSERVTDSSFGSHDAASPASSDYVFKPDVDQSSGRASLDATTVPEPGAGFVVEEVSFEESEDVFTAFRDEDTQAAVEVETQTATETAVYVYGVANGSAAGHAWPDEGMDETYPVRTIGFEGLHAIVSNVPSSEYTGSGGEENMKRVDWLKDRARRHAVILESLKLGDTFVPMRFCTIMDSDAAVEEMLASEFDHYRSVIDRVKGAEEWSIRVYRDLEQLEEKVRDSDRKVEDSLGVISQGVVNFVKEEMRRIDKMGGEAVELITDHCVRRSHAALLECARDGLLKPVIADETGGDIILSAAYLVDDDSEARIKDEVDRLASEYEELGFKFELSGPWPPYHFVGTGGPADDASA